MQIFKGRKMTVVKVKTPQVHFAVRNYCAIFINLFRIIRKVLLLLH